MMQDLASLRRRLDLVRWIELDSFVDERGRLTPIEGGQHVPFEIARVYTVHGVGAARAGHAHLDTQQLAIAVHGRVSMALSDGRERRAFELDSPARGLYFGPLLFIEITQMEIDSVLMVLASTHYDKNRSLRSWTAFVDALEELG